MKEKIKKRHRMARVCLWGLGFLYFFAIFADFISPYSYDDEDRDFSYCPATRIEFFDEGALCLPFVYGRRLTFDAMHRRVYVMDKTKKYPLRFLKAGRLLSVDQGGRLYLWGADSRGRDLFSRIWYGARISLSIGLLGAAISFVLGLLVGGIAGFYGGWIDCALMRVTEMFMMIPGFYLMLAARAAVPGNFNSVQVYFSVVIILAFIGWASLARVIRGMSLSLRERDYVLAARTFGVPNIVIIVRHILPQTISFSLSTLMLTISSYILAEAGLSVIGLGIQDPVPSWGNLLGDAMNIVPVLYAPWMLLPGLFIFISVVCFNVIGDALRDAFDPLVA